MSRISPLPSPHVMRKRRLRAGLVLACLNLSVMFAQQQTSPVPEPVRTSITVVEKIEMEAPGFVSTMTQQDVSVQPGVNLDDRLRSVPGFSLFRRSSSLV